MDNYQYNDKLFEILDYADSNCSSSLVESLVDLVYMAQDKSTGWKKISGKRILEIVWIVDRNYHLLIYIF